LRVAEGGAVVDGADDLEVIDLRSGLSEDPEPGRRRATVQSGEARSSGVEEPGLLRLPA
jgi:hypothetical protein